MPVKQRDVVKRGISASFVVLLCFFCMAFGWTAHREICFQVADNVNLFDATFRFYQTFQSPESFFSALGVFLLISIKIFVILKNKRQGDR